MKGDQPRIHFVPKGWGFEKWIVNKKEYCGKLLYFARNRNCSLHFHKLKDETFYIRKGKVEILYHDDPKNLKAYLKDTTANYALCCEKIVLEPGDTFYVPPGRAHQIFALEDTELFEFSTQHFDEDSYRLVKGD
jgi:mannose-6-phosphate isomerase-like protein (cupin superfamily)